MKFYLLIFLLVFGQIIFGFAQTNYEIEGKLLNSKTKEAISFANIFNKNLQKGTISNEDGYFKILVQNFTDTILVTFIGFKTQRIVLKENVRFYVLNLEPSALQLNEVYVIAKDESYLFDLVQAVKKSNSTNNAIAKTYFDLKTFVDDKQIELVESYYNADIQGYTLKELYLKAGRVAVKPYKNRYFTSLESSKVIVMLDLLKGNEYFPTNPLELNRKQLKNNFILALDQKYLNDSSDSIFVIDYIPKDTSGAFFKGKIWLNKTKMHIVKVTLVCNGAKKHPFLPLYPMIDEISNPNLRITKTYFENEKQAVFKHVDFVYSFDYRSRVGRPEEESYKITTKAVLYAYDFEKQFFEPMFKFESQLIGDYRMIGAFPYNEFFWKNNTEYQLNDSLNINLRFFSDSAAITNTTIFKSNTFSKQGIFEHPFIHWSKERIKFREVFVDSLKKRISGSVVADQYNLSVKIYVDINTYNDSTQIISATIFDPYESFYYLPMDKKTHCFVNMYFDLCEIQRRELLAKLELEKNNSNRVKEIYANFLNDFESNKTEFLRLTQRGTNETEMRRYNELVYNKLGINNLELFQPFVVGE